jgi:BirA family biotin operon repressor/biotin-[acetyl-CoA-carboxylase] ligase
MTRAAEVLGFLRGCRGHVSGDFMASRLNITRTAVWKLLKHLEEIGYTFERTKGKGYRLIGAPDRLYPWEIGRYLETKFVGRTLVYRDSVGSTNGLAFELALAGCAEGTCVVAETQTAGRGRLRRTWYSPRGKNLYLSCVLRPALHPSQVYPLTFISSLAVYDTLKTEGLEPRLKWPNDVLIDSRKVSGTLIELSCEADRVRFVVIGIGLNVNMEEADMHEEIADKATSLLIVSKKPFERARICGMLLGNLEHYYEVVRSQGMGEICRTWEERARIRGTYMEITQMGTTYRGISEGIDGDGAILLREKGAVTRVVAGDVVS